MSDTISWVLQLKVKPGELEAFRALMEEMVAHTRLEAGTLAYEWFISGDEDEIHLYERYLDSAAALTHLVGFGKHFAERFTVATDATGMNVYGNADDALRKALRPMAAEFLGPFGGFAR